MTESLRITTLGGLDIRRSGEPVTGLASRKAEALLVYLACTPGAHARESLATMLWDDRAQSRALANLSVLLTSLRKQLTPYLIITPKSVAFNLDSEFWLDAADLEQGINRWNRQRNKNVPISSVDIDRMAGTVKLYRGEFLNGFFIRDSRDFEEWLILERERIRLLVFRVFEEMADYYMRQESHEKAMETVWHLLEMDSLHEGAHRQMITLLAARGQRGAAMAQFETCRRILVEQLGVQPSEETQELYTLIANGEMPSGISEKPASHNLPIRATSLIGRDEDVTKILELLASPSVRMVTLAGVGGIGKTSLGLRGAAEAQDLFADGVWLAELASLTDADLLPDLIASIFDVSAQEARAGRGVLDILLDFLRDKNILLVLDNCEHLIDSCSAFVESLCKTCPQVKVLVTSRESLGIAMEYIYQVDPLVLPHHETDSRELESYPAVRLFMERARAARPGLEVEPANAGSIARISEQLDGIPLAIELAAARVKVLSLDQISDRLQDRFQLLAGGPRTALPRHQTLQATMDWSYELLTDLEREFLRRLSVFSNGWSLESAERVISFRDGNGQTLDLMTKLVEKSLVFVEQLVPVARYNMLETVRQFGQIQLSPREEEELNQRHAQHFLELAEIADVGLRSSRQLDSLEILDAEHDNLRKALGWSINAEETDLALRLVGALGWYWFMRGHWQEARRWLENALDLDPPGAPGIRAKAVIRAGGMELMRGNLDGTFERIEEALDVCREIGDEEGTAWCLNLLGDGLTWVQERIGEAIPLLSESIEIFNTLNDDWGVAFSTRYLAQVADINGDYERSVALHEKGLRGFEEIGDTWNTAHSAHLLGVTAIRYSKFQKAREAYEICQQKCRVVKDKVMAPHARMGLARVALQREEYESALELFGEAIEPLQKIGDKSCVAYIHRDLALISIRKNDLDQAAEYLNRSLRSFEELNSKDNIAWILERFAILASKMGKKREAARLLGAADVHLGKVENLPPMYRVEMEQQVSSSQRSLGEKTFGPLFAEGAAMSLEEAAQCALEVTAGRK